MALPEMGQEVLAMILMSNLILKKDDKSNNLKSHFVPSGKQNDVRPKGRDISKPKGKIKPHGHFNYTYMYRYPTQKPEFVKNSGKTNSKGVRKIWVPKDKIVYCVDIISSGVKKPDMVSGLLMLAVYDRKKAYVTNPRT